MIIKKTKLKGCFILEPKIFQDKRGYFFESFNRHIFEKFIGHEINFVQDNQSYSLHGVIRALHYQLGEYAQAKLVRVLQGRVLDVAVDLRKESETFGQHVAIELSAANQKQMFIPKGFAHGFSVLSEGAEFFYKCDNYYNKSSEGGIIYNDDDLAIDWGISSKNIKVSDKDLILPNFKNALLQ